MIEQIQQFFSSLSPSLNRFILVTTIFVVAYLLRIVTRLVILGVVDISKRFRNGRGRRIRTERVRTINRLLISTATVVYFAAACLISLGLFIGATNVIWLVGLFAAAFGLGARPLVSDLLTGASFLFYDPFDVGEKVEFIGLTTVEGVVEHINVSSTVLRARSGELYTVPNGEIRTIRNFSRGSFSLSNTTIKINSADMTRALELLDSLKAEAVVVLPNMLEPWEVMSETGRIGQSTELYLVVKTKFAKSAELKPRLLSFIQDQFAKADILVD